jgi:hypothetical protein
VREIRMLRSSGEGKRNACAVPRLSSTLLFPSLMLLSGAGWSFVAGEDEAPPSSLASPNSANGGLRVFREQAGRQAQMVCVG